MGTTSNTQTISSFNFLIQEPAEVYHGKAVDNLSSHQLGNFRRCPLLFHRKRLGLIADEDRPAYLVGRAAHTAILEGPEVYEQTYAVGGPTNPRTGKSYGTATKAWKEWANAQQKEVLTEAQHRLVMQMAIGVANHERAYKLLSDGVAEGVVRTEYCNIPSQIRLDWLNPHRGIVDLKTTDDLQWFEADAKRYGYIHQVAFYQAVLAEVIGIFMPVFFIAVEKKEPFRAGVWQVSEDSLAIARSENEAAIGRLLRCEEAGEWDTGYEEVRSFECV